MITGIILIVVEINNVEIIPFPRNSFLRIKPKPSQKKENYKSPRSHGSFATGFLASTESYQNTTARALFVPMR